MLDVWGKFKSDEMSNGICVEGLKNEEEKRNINPNLYDAALCVYEYDNPQFILHLLEKKKINVNDLTIRTKQPLLFLALNANRIKSVEILINSGADLNYTLLDKDYLYWAVRNNCDVEIINNLISTENFKINTEIILTAIRKCEEDTINILINKAHDTDKIIDEGDDNFSMLTTIFEELINNNLYDASINVLKSDSMNTIKRLKEIDFLEILDSRIKQEPQNFDFSSFLSKKRIKPPYSKNRLEEIKKIIENKFISYS